MDLRHVLGLLGLLAVAHAQILPVPVNQAVNLPQNIGVIGVSSYANSRRTAAGGVPAGSQTVPIPTFEECLRTCINTHVQIVPVGAIMCRAVTFITGATTDNCIRFNTCDVTDANYVQDPAATHYVITNYCANNRVLRFGSVAIDVSQLPSTGDLAISTLTETFDRINCEFQCNIDPLCVAADHTTNSATLNCRRFRRSTTITSVNQCLPTTNLPGYTAVQAACSTIVGFNGGAFQGSVTAPGIPMAQMAVVADYQTCLTTCNGNANCVGFKYNMIAALSGAATGDYCEYYLKETIGSPLLCGTITSNTAEVTVLKSQCPFNIFNNMQQVQGIPQFDYRTLYKCKIECQYHPMCTGFDFNSLTTTSDRERCWFHFENEAGCEPLRMVNDNCCQHWQIRNSRCSTNTDNYYFFEQSRITTGGTIVAGLNTYALCLQHCNNDANCKGFDFNTVANTCTAHLADTVCTGLTTDTSTTHYRKRSYECMWRFRNSKKSGGTPVAGISVVGQCERICRQTSGCEGFDFDTMGRVTDRMCYLHLAGTICNTLFKDASLMHFRLRTRVCPDEEAAPLIIAQANWGNAQQNMHTLGNTPIGRQDSAIECLRLCKTTDGCAGIDYDRQTAMCYPVIRSRACGEGVPLDFIDRILLPDGCSAPTVAGYSGTSDSHRVGGRLAQTNSNRQACANLCSADPLCLAFDFDKIKNECWLQSTTQECRQRSQIFSNPCCDRYVNSTFSCSNYQVPAFTGYVPRDMRHTIGGQQEASTLNLVTPRLCTERCTILPGCISVDFNFERNQCYTHSNSTACSTEFINANTIRYVKSGNCGL